MSTLKVSNVVPKDGETMNLGESGSDTVVPVGSTITNNGTAIGFGGSGGPSATRVYTTSGTWTKPDNVSTIMVEVQGGGGAGNVAASYTQGTCGAYGKKLIDVSGVSSATITVGAGGAGGLAVGPDGGLSSWDDTSNGGTSVVSAMGGYGGSTSTLSNLNTTAVVATGADISVEGGMYASPLGSLAYFGAAAVQNIKDGFGYGSGGGGNHNTWPGTSGSGGDGVVIVTEFSEAGASGSGGGGSSSSGNILQVLQATKEDTFTTTSESFVDIPGLSLTITPSNSSSKVLINTTIGIGSANISHIQVRRDGVDIAPGITPPAGYASGYSGSSVNDGNTIEPLNIHFLDEPSTASPVVYTVAVKCRQSSSMTAINRTTNDSSSTNLGIRSKSYITAMEVAG